MQDTKDNTKPLAERIAEYEDLQTRVQSIADNPANPHSRIAMAHLKHINDMLNGLKLARLELRSAIARWRETEST